MADKKKDLPAQPFYWGDWFKAIDVQSLPRETRCVWFEMIGRMWESNERGYLTINGKPMSDFAKASALGFGSAVSEYLKHEKILEEYGIFSRRESDGAIYSRKILNYMDLSEKRAQAGSKGGKKTWHFAKAVAKDFALANTETENETENEYSLKEDVPALFTKRWNRPYKNNSELQLAEKLVLEFGYQATDDAFRIAGERGDKTSVPYVRGILNKEREQKEMQKKSQQRFTSPIMEEMYGSKK